MTCIQHYDSPLGGILLAADDDGLTGLWFDGEKYFADHLPAEHTERGRRSLRRPRAGWISTSPGGSRTFCRRCIPLVLRFARLCGRSCCRSPMAARRPMGRSRSSLQSGEDARGCPHRRSAGLWGITRSPSSSPATGWSAQTAA